MDLPKNIESYYQETGRAGRDLNIESYYQETGRAGRDGLPSDALLFYSYGDVMKLKRFAQIENNAEQTEILLKKLDQMGQYGELTICRRKYLLNYFDEQADERCGNCDVCLNAGELIDATALAQKVFATVKRVGERFGIGYVIDFLRGSRSAKMLSWHRTLELFGSGTDLSRDGWTAVISELIQRGYLMKSYTDGYPLLKLAGNSQAVLSGAEKVMLTKSRERVAGWAELQGRKLPYEADLYEQLKAVRKKFAEEENVAPYIILSDLALSEMAMYLPQTRFDLAHLSGFGETKLDRYGPALLAEITAHCRKYDLPSNMHLKGEARRAAAPKDTHTMQQSLTLFRQGKSVDQIAALRKLTVGTVERHLTHYVEKGQIDLDSLVDPARAQPIREAIEHAGTAKLTPIKELLGEAYSYSEIRYVLAGIASSQVEEPEEMSFE
jgi:ATP-dependent DNA helicase RecQ